MNLEITIPDGLRIAAAGSIAERESLYPPFGECAAALVATVTELASRYRDARADDGRIAGPERHDLMDTTAMAVHWSVRAIAASFAVSPRQPPFQPNEVTITSAGNPETLVVYNRATHHWTLRGRMPRDYRGAPVAIGEHITLFARGTLATLLTRLRDFAELEMASTFDHHFGK